MDLSCSRGLLSGNEIAGRVGDLNLRVSQQEWDRQTQFRVESRDIPRELFLRREGFIEIGRDIQIHDGPFDRAVRVRGDERIVFALLTRENRAKLAYFVGKRGGVIESGVVQISVPESIEKAAELQSLIEDVLDVARRLSLPVSDVRQRLAGNVTGTDRVSIRLKNLELLQQHYGTQEIARQTSLEALEDGRSEIRLQAAFFLQELETITEIAATEAEPVDARIRAIRFLIKNAPSDNVPPLLEELLDSLAPTVRKEAITGLGELGHRPAVGKLCSLATTEDPETAAALCSALAKIGDSAAEPALLTLLEREDKRQKIAAVDALGHLGSATSVEPLMKLTGHLLSPDLSRAAKEAIAKIQSRLNDAEAGRLTLAELTEREGALSLCREGGELSLPDGEKVLPRGDKDDGATGK
jgi:hypothetical protein